MHLKRRKFLQISAATAASIAALNRNNLALSSMVTKVDNPLSSYPDVKWERLYHDQYRYDRTFTYACSPNDTHQCRVRAFVRNGVVMRTEQNYAHQNYGDIYGNKATRNWNPRMCLKGYTFARRVYGPYRLKYPMIRKMWKQWADDGFPHLSEDNRVKYKFRSRASDGFVRVSWDDAFMYAAKGFEAIARRYSGKAGGQLLLDQGYDPDMVKDMGGAGTRTLKFRGGMGLLQVIGVYGTYRVSTMMALLDVYVRGATEKNARGGRNWSNYTWHGDQAPGHPWSHGLQTSDIDFNDLRFSKLTIQVGKNLIENKMPEAHWLAEIQERGGTIVTISPEYNPPATKSDYWIPIRPGLSDTSIFLYITKSLIDNNQYDKDFVKGYTDFPLLIRTDNLKKLRANDVIKDHKNLLKKDGYSYAVQGLTDAQYKKIGGDFCVWDSKTNSVKAISRDHIGKYMKSAGIDPALEGTFKVKLKNGEEVPVMPVFQMYKVHLQDYDLDSVHEICGAEKSKLKRLAHDFATIKPISIHYGEGINHWFHATLHNRATYLPLMLTGNLGAFGSGSHTWAGNYKAGNWQASKWSGPGFYGLVAEDPFHQNLDPKARAKDLKIKGRAKGEEVGYWNHGDMPLVVNTPKYGRKNFTGWSAMPTPTKALWYVNVNLFNNAKHHYDMIFNVNPKIEMIITSDIEMTSSAEYSDIIFAANTWMEKEVHECATACSNPFIQIWKGGIKPLYDTLDDLNCQAGVANALFKLTGDKRFYNHYKFALEGNHDVYLNRILDGSTTTTSPVKGKGSYSVEKIIKGEYGEEGGALMMYRTYPRNSFWEQTQEDRPTYLDHGRFAAYSDDPTAIEAGENFIVHREGPEATPFLPNVIVSTNPYIRPDDQGLPEDAEHWDERTVRNIKKPWSAVKRTKNFLWEKGYKFYCVTPKTRHRVHSQWSVCDWNLIWNNNYGDPYRMDKRCPGVGEHQLHINPQAAKDMGIGDGDYVYADANPADRPYRNWRPSDPRYKVARLMVRAKYNPAYPYSTTMMKHAPYTASEKTVKAHESRPDGRAVSADTGYQSNFRYGSQQSVTRDWSMPMHQTDTLFHKKKIAMRFFFGCEPDNHGVNTVPKETLIKITKAEDAGIGGVGLWDPVKTGLTPANENRLSKMYLKGKLVRVNV